MANASIFAQQIALNWLFNTGGTATQPPQIYAGLCLATPNSTAASELTVFELYSRASVTMGTVATPAGSMSNVNAFTFSFTRTKRTATIQGLVIFNTATTGSGSPLMYGTLATNWTVTSGDTIAFAAGSLVITLA